MVVSHRNSGFLWKYRKHARACVCARATHTHAHTHTQTHAHTHAHTRVHTTTCNESAKPGRSFSRERRHPRTCSLSATTSTSLIDRQYTMPHCGRATQCGHATRGMQITDIRRRTDQRHPMTHRSETPDAQIRHIRRTDQRHPTTHRSDTSDAQNAYQRQRAKDSNGSSVPPPHKCC